MSLQDAVEYLSKVLASGRSLREIIEQDQRRRLNADIKAELEYGQS